jgi:hypothetical protein
MQQSQLGGVSTQTVLQGDEALAYVKGLETRQDFITTLGAKQGLWNQAIKQSAISYDMARCWEINASIALSTPIYQDLGNGWTTALIPYTAVCNPDGAYGSDAFVVDANTGYIYNRASQRMTYDEWGNLETAYNCTAYGKFAVYTPVAGVMNSDFTIYTTILSTSIVNDGVTATETGYYYFLYPSTMTGITFVVPNKCYTLTADMQVFDGESYATNSAFMNNCTFFKIN